MEVKLYNTETKKIEKFEPLAAPLVTLYTCGPTVYYHTHIGHIRAYTNSDILRRTLEYAGYNVRHVMNITDVGHMTSDEDEGEDKLEVGARREKKTVWEIARQYEDTFFESTDAANIKRPTVVCRATEHVQQQINLIKKLEENGLTYRTSVGITFDTAKFPEYANFARLDLEGQRAGAGGAIDEERRNPQDFALWVTNKPNHIMMWDSPWGRGFPGWHIECSAMAMHYLGETIDIHTGGIEHINIHHTNEIAQSQGATGKKFTRYWFHTAFLNIDNAKMAKSEGNFYQLKDLAARGISPFALRYFMFGSSYRKPLNFTWESLQASDTALTRIYEKCKNLPAPSATPDKETISAFEEAICDDLNMPKALAVLWDVIGKEPTADRAAAIYKMDEVFGLDLASAITRLSDRRLLKVSDDSKEDEAMKLAQKRIELRKEKKFAEADQVRDQILALGFIVKDTPEGPRLDPK